MGQVLSSSPTSRIPSSNTRRYVEIIKDITNKVKPVDDTLLCDQDTESAFTHGTT